jgi:Sulfotransferase family
MNETTTAHPTIASSWRARSDDWQSRSPSSFAGSPRRPLLIGACPRSGTTLLRSLLNNHPEIAVPGETDFVMPIWLARESYGNLRDPANRRRIGEWIFMEDGHGGRRLRAGGIGREEAVERVVASPPTLGSIFSTCFRIYAEAHGKPRWGDKRPKYVHHVRAMFDLFPDAQFVNLIRDPRGAVSSLITLGWYPEKVAVPSAASAWEASIRNLDRRAGALRPDQLLDIRFEDMALDPAASLRRVCSFAGLRDDDEAIEQMIARENVGNLRQDRHWRIREPISSAPVDAWRKRLRTRDVALVEHVTRPYMERFGYVPGEAAGTEPKRRDVEEFEQQRKRRVKRWRGVARQEFRRRHLTYRRPVAALPAE